MKDYGMIVADNGSNFFFSGASYSVDASDGFALTWDDNDIQDSVHGLKSLLFSDFEVVDLTPAVAGLSAAAGAPGTTLTVTGSNFSGAAGRLQVLFGNTPSPTVTVLDDGHLTAVVPALGSGTVDVRVQSGVNAPGNSSNVENPVFGYGTSAVTAADRFTVTQAPTVSLAPVAPSPRNTAVSSMTITFSKSVLGFTLANLQLTTASGGNLLTASQTLTTTDHVTWVLGNLAGLTDPTHRVATFTLALSPAGVTDSAGNPLAGGASTSFVVIDPSLVLQGQTLTFTGTPGNDSFAFQAGGAAHVTLNGVNYSVDPTLASTVNFVGNGGSDTATVTTQSGGGSTLSLSPGGGTLSGPGYTLRLIGFGQVVAAGGPGDRAYLTGPAGNGVFVATPAYAYLYGAGTWEQADGFGAVFGYAGAGGGSSAYLYDSVGNDFFLATPTYAYLDGPGFFNLASGFSRVVGNSSSGSDGAYLYGAAAGGNVFVATPTYGYLYGGGFFNEAVGFKSVVGNAAGANNAAYLYDSPGNDVFVATSTYAYLAGAGFLNQAVGFAAVNAYSTGGSDQAYLLGSGTAADGFIDGGTYAYLYGNAFSVLASNFGSVYVNPAAHR
jgi:hypothetical protein